MSTGYADVTTGWQVNERVADLLTDLTGSLRILASGEMAEGELHLAISRAIANAIRIELLATAGHASESDVERRMAEVFRAGLTLA